jgi:hypothetical protein
MGGMNRRDILKSSLQANWAYIERKKLKKDKKMLERVKKV